MSRYWCLAPLDDPSRCQHPAPDPNNLEKSQPASIGLFLVCANFHLLYTGLLGGLLEFNAE